MKVEVYADGDAVALEAARLIAQQARESVAARGKFVMAVSGGKTPWIMLRKLAEEDVPWDGVHIVQVDERVAPEGDPDRNLTHLRASLLEHAPLCPERIHAMPVESGNIDSACAQYATALKVIAGTAPVVDLIHLGLGPDGHTASLVPGDPVLQVKDADVAVTGIYQKRRRMTLTYPIINRARFVLWLVTGNEKAGMLPRLIAADSSIPAGRVSTVRSLALVDSAAGAQMDRSSKTGVA